MARTKRSSVVLETARQRLAGLKSITPAPDFGPGVSIADYEQEISAFATTLDSYHQDLSALDEKQNLVEEREDALRVRNRRMLRATEAKYGPDSSEYEQAGGKRVSDHKSRTRKAKTDDIQGNVNPPPTA